MDGGSAFLEILFFGMVAAFLVLRLRSVLGKRMGHERDNGSEQEPVARREASAKPDSNASADTNVVPLPGARLPDGNVQRALTQIQKADRNFDPHGFVAGAKTAFELILTAFANGDRDTLRSLTSGDVYAMMEGEMTRIEQNEQTLEFTLVRIRSADIIDAALDGSDAKVTLKIASEQINVVRDGEGHAIQGKHGVIETVTDVWTFSRDTRSGDPNWILSEVRDAPSDSDSDADAS